MPGEIVVQKIKYYRSNYDIWIKSHIKERLLIVEEVADEVVITSLTLCKICSRIPTPEGTLTVLTRNRDKVDREYAICRYDGSGGEDRDRMNTSGS